MPIGAPLWQKATPAKGFEFWRGLFLPTHRGHALGYPPRTSPVWGSFRSQSWRHPIGGSASQEPGISPLPYFSVASFIFQE
ncbi:MAG TPA: hypothetical protein IGS52_11375 [Oscillatoriaceae cyanobacterium M33_DOE_052]|uniref:Uncharacterized protein n=1 Tax=Planktothricoides sp. SpSt-374 TaxID=2282167 RepID=A0A7C3ZQF3_9CYAN|nr:hypothetical protein [Oscillatoriaceae cyanobacterium M33_DOE_052]